MMRRSNFVQFNPQRYEEGLSPFGCSVLKVLICQWNAERDRLRRQDAANSYQRGLPSSNRSYKKILTFDDANAPSQRNVIPPTPALNVPYTPRFPTQHPTVGVPSNLPNVLADEPIKNRDIEAYRNGNVLHDHRHHEDGNIEKKHNSLLTDDTGYPSPAKLRPNSEASIHEAQYNNSKFTYDDRAHQIGNMRNFDTTNVNTRKTSTNRNIHDVPEIQRTHGIINKLTDIYMDDIIPSTDERMVFPFFNKNKTRNIFPRFDDVPDISTADSPPFEDINVVHDIQGVPTMPSDLLVPTADKLFMTVEKSSERPPIATTGKEDDLLNTPLAGKVRVDNSHKSSDIGWNDMFDTELITDVEQANVQPVKDNPPSENLKLIDKKKSKVNVQNKSSIAKVPKRKVQTKVTDSVSKKVKTVKMIDVGQKVSKNPFRKENYTTAVKNWLDGVDASHKPEEEVPFPTASQNPVHNTKRTKKVSPNGKKIIQAQLANKDGIMKFGKPSPNNLTATDTNDNEINIRPTKKKNSNTKAQTSIEEQSGENKPEGAAANEAKKETIKKLETHMTKNEMLPNTSNSTMDLSNQSCARKKPKRKFVVPLKSQPSQQTPVDVELHDIRTVMAEDADHCSMLPERSQVVVMLMYSNGFCQANAQHASREGHADAVMAMLADAAEGTGKFYHVPGTEGTQAKFLKHILDHCTIICYDGKDLLKYLMVHLQVDVEHMEVDIQDLKVGGSLLSPESPPESLAAVQRLLQQPVAAARGDARNKAASYALQLQSAAALLWDQLKENNMWKLFADVEMKVLPILAAMEQRGIRVDTTTLASLDKALEQAVQSAEVACHTAAGKVFQVQSPAAVRALIYDELKLDQLCKLKVRHTPHANDKSTSETMLKQLVSVHPLPRRILRYRQLHKVRSTFIAGISRYTKKDVLKPIWLQCAAATGRIACANPNLQALPKHSIYLDDDDDKCIIDGDVTDDDDDVRDAADDDAVDFLRSTISSETVPLGRCVVSVRSVVTAGSDGVTAGSDGVTAGSDGASCDGVTASSDGAGRVLLSADYRHLECRLLAHAARDQRLLSALAAPDLFKELAMHWLKKPVSSVRCEERERCKSVVYAAAYGGGAQRLGELLGANGPAAAQDVLDSFNKTFPSISAFARSVWSRCSANGGVITLQSGRRRSLPDILCEHAARRARAARQAVNFVIQGAAADLCKLAMVRCVAALRARGLQAQLLLTVHDELVWTVPRHQLHAAAQTVQQTMESCGQEMDAALRLPVALRCGPHWGHMTPLRLTRGAT